MKAAQFHDFGEPDDIRYEERPSPPLPEPGEVRIRIVAASVNPSQWKIASGMAPHLVAGFPYIPGHDLAGFIESIGRNVKSLVPGQRVIAYGKVPHWGTWADAITMPAAWVAPAPKGLSAAAAASMPTVALTAWEAVVEDLQVVRGQRLLITAAAGGVGSMAVQLAKDIGAKIMGAASPHNFGHLRDLGCDHVIDYRDLSDSGLDRAFDGVVEGGGSASLAACYPLVREGGRISSLSEAAIDGQWASLLGIHVNHPTAHPSGERLAALSRLVEDGTLVLHVERTFPMSDAAVALNTVKAGHVRGKIVLINHPDARADWPAFSAKTIGIGSTVH